MRKLALAAGILGIVAVTVAATFESLSTARVTPLGPTELQQVGGTGDCYDYDHYSCPGIAPLSCYSYGECEERCPGSDEWYCFPDDKNVTPLWYNSLLADKPFGYFTAVPAATVPCATCRLCDCWEDLWGDQHDCAECLDCDFYPCLGTFQKWRDNDGGTRNCAPTFI